MLLLFLTGGWWHLQKGLIGLWFLLKALSVQKRFILLQGPRLQQEQNTLLGCRHLGGPQHWPEVLSGPNVLKNLNFLVLKPKSHFVAETWFCFEFQISESGLLKKKKLEFQFSTR